MVVVGGLILQLLPPKARFHEESEPSPNEPQVGGVDGARLATPPGKAAIHPRAGTKSSTGVSSVSGTDRAEGTVRVKAGVVLATVNGVAIELKDLVPVPPGDVGVERILSSDRYTFLLDRAVDREITLQTARAQGIDLTESQREQLAGLRARSETSEASLFDELQHDPANTEFEARDALASLLQASLAEKAGVPPRDVTAERVEQYYQQYQADYGELPSDPTQRQAAWESIDQRIRVKLAREVQSLHEESFQNYMKQLREAAQIVKGKPSSALALTEGD